MTRELIGFLAISLVVVIAVSIWLSTKKKRRIQEQSISAPLPATATGDFATLYVSTVFDEARLDRVWAHGLGMRGNAMLAVDASGVSVVRVGEDSFLIPAANLYLVEAATATIDKAVEKSGLTAIHWSLGETKVISHFRFTNPLERKEFESKILQLIGAQIG
jgi:hypothetical protein